MDLNQGVLDCQNYFGFWLTSANFLLKIIVSFWIIDVGTFFIKKWDFGWKFM